MALYNPKRKTANGEEQIQFPQSAVEGLIDALAEIVPITRGGTGAESKQDAIANLLYFPKEILPSLEEDTVANWHALGFGYTWLNNQVITTDQPVSWGFLINIPTLITGNTPHVYQLLAKVGGGGNKLYHRQGWQSTSVSSGWVASWEAVNATADIATKLAKARTIGLSGPFSSTPQAFDRTQNITIPVSSIKEAYLEWGGKSVAGSITPLDGAMSARHAANRLAFIKPEGVLVEYSRDGGETWSNSNPTEREIAQLMSDIPYTSKAFSAGNLAYWGGKDVPEEYLATLNDKLRITIKANEGEIYTAAKKLLLNMNIIGSKNCTVHIEGALNGDRETFVNDYGTFPISGWTGWNSIPLSVTFGGSLTTQQTQVGALRFTFSIGELGTSGYSNQLIVVNMALYGTSCWKAPSNLAENNHIYEYDWQQNVTFPAKVTATGFTGDVTGTASKAIADEEGFNIKETYAKKYSTRLTFKSNGDGTCSVQNIGACQDSHIIIPDKSPNNDIVTGIGANAFAWSTHIISVTLPDSITSIGSNAFVGCDNLKQIILSKHITTIDDYAFSGSGLTEIVIPDSLVSLNLSAFDDCNLTTIYYVGTEDEWNNLTNYEWSYKWPNTNFCFNYINTFESLADYYTYLNKYFIFTLIDDDHYSVKGSMVATKWPETLVIPAWYKNKPVTVIEDWGFNYSFLYNFHDSVKTIIIEEGITTIGSYAFQAYDSDPVQVDFNSSITEIKLPSTITTIKDGAFSYCLGLKKINLEATKITRLEYYTFAECYNLKQLRLPNTLNYIGDEVFNSGYPSPIENIIIPKEVTTIEGIPFCTCPKLTICCEAETAAPGWGTNWNKLYSESGNLDSYIADIPVIFNFKTDLFALNKQLNLLDTSEKLPVIRFANYKYIEGTEEDSSLHRFTVENLGGGQLRVGDQLQICVRKQYCQGKYKLKVQDLVYITEEDLNKRILKIEVSDNCEQTPGQRASFLYYNDRAGNHSTYSSIYFRLKRPIYNAEGKEVNAIFSNVVPVWKTYRRTKVSDELIIFDSLKIK